VGPPLAASLEISLLLAPGGEFAFIGIGMASLLNLVGAEVAATVLAVVSLTMALLPLLASLGRRLATRLETGKSFGAAGDGAAAGRPSARVSSSVTAASGNWSATCSNHHKCRISPPIAIPSWSRAGANAAARSNYGDVSKPAVPRSCGIGEAPRRHPHDRQLRDRRGDRAHRAGTPPDVLIVARARDAQHARHLYTLASATRFRDDRASLQLAESALVGLGVPMGLVIASIHEAPRGRAQGAAAAAGGPGALAATVREHGARPPAHATSTEAYFCMKLLRSGVAIDVSR